MSSKTTRQTSDMPAFARNLNAALAATGETTEGFARRVDLTLRMVQRYRHGDSEPSGANAVRLARALGLTVEELFAEEPSPTQEAA